MRTGPFVSCFQNDWFAIKWLLVGACRWNWFRSIPQKLTNQLFKLAECSMTETVEPSFSIWDYKLACSIYPVPHQYGCRQLNARTGIVEWQGKIKDPRWLQLCCGVLTTNELWGKKKKWLCMFMKPLLSLLCETHTNPEPLSKWGLWCVLANVLKNQHHVYFSEDKPRAMVSKTNIPCPAFITP